MSPDIIPHPPNSWQEPSRPTDPHSELVSLLFKRHLSNPPTNTKVMNRAYHIGETVKVLPKRETIRSPFDPNFSFDMDNNLPPERLVRIIDQLDSNRYKVSATWWQKNLMGYIFSPYMFDPTYFDSLDRINLSIKLELAREGDKRIYREGTTSLLDIEFVGELPYHIIDHPFIHKKIDTKRINLPEDLKITRLISDEELEGWRSFVDPGLFCDQITYLYYHNIQVLRTLIATKGYAMINGSYDTTFAVEGITDSVYPSWLVVLPEKEIVVEEINELSEDLEKLEKRFVMNKHLLEIINK